jgi:hypothetical protein
MIEQDLFSLPLQCSVRCASLHSGFGFHFQRFSSLLGDEASLF